MGITIAYMETNPAAPTAVDTLIVNWLTYQYGATVTVRYDTADFNAHSYDLLIMSDQCNTSTTGGTLNYRDSAAPVILLDGAGVANWYIGTGTNGFLDAEPTWFIRDADNATNWISRYMMDTLDISGTGGTSSIGVYTLAGLPSGMKRLYRNKDTFTVNAVVAYCDSGAALTTGTAAEKRAFVGHFYYASTVTYFNWQDAWEPLGRVIAKLTDDTTYSNAWLKKVKVSGRFCTQRCWTEVGSDDSACYGGEAASGQFRWGWDGQKVLSFMRIGTSVLQRKIMPNNTIDSIACLFPIKTVAINGGGDSSFSMRLGMHKILRATKFRCPNIGECAYPDCRPNVTGETWVSRYFVVGGQVGSTISWVVKNMQVGTEYESAAVDTFFADSSTQVPRTGRPTNMNMTIPSSIALSWYSDSTTNNGVVIMPDSLYDLNSDAEIGTGGNYEEQNDWENDAGVTPCPKIIVWMTAGSTAVRHGLIGIHK